MDFSNPKKPVALAMGFFFLSYFCIMPNVYKKPINGYRFFFYSKEGNEPAHIHVEKAENIAKFWLEPVSLAVNHGFSSSEISLIEKMINVRKVRITKAWNEYFGA